MKKLLSLLMMVSLFAEMPCSFFPPNNLRYPVDLNNRSQMNERTFNQIMSAIEGVYRPLFREEGHPDFRIVKKWSDDTLNAWALICSKEWKDSPELPGECQRMHTSLGVWTDISIITMYGGLARHPLMTEDGMVLVACHEIGHHLGGFPRKVNNTRWAATEGQSDYYATMKCARRVFKKMGNTNVAAIKVPFMVRNQCQKSFPGRPQDAAICMRSSEAGRVLARVLGSLGKNDPSSIDFDKKDRKVVQKTFENHPEAQCRLDTYFAGALCEVSEEVNFATDNPWQGACEQGKINDQGPRPACWFASRRN